jgi:hypothetical protein
MNPPSKTGEHVSPGGRARKGAFAAIISAIATCATAHGGVVDINGGSSWGGWSRVGNSQTSGMWMAGSTVRRFDIYATTFSLEASQTVGGNRVADGSAGNGLSYAGDTQASLFDGSWRVGDRIAGIGIRYTDASQTRMFFMLVDWAGDSMRAASSFGVMDGLYAANAGDLSIYTAESAGGDRFRATQYGVATDPNPQGGSSIAPYGTVATTASPARAFAILGNGSANSAISAQYFLNLDAILRSNGGATFGEGVLGPATKFGLAEGQLGTDFTMQMFSIPAPGAFALLGAALVAPLRPRSRRGG